MRKLREETIYSGPHSKDVQELEPHQVPWRPDTKLLAIHYLIKSPTQQKQLGCLNGVTGFWPFWAAWWWAFLAHSKASVCSGLSAVLGHLCLSIRYNIGSRDLKKSLGRVVTEQLLGVHRMSNASFSKELCTPGAAGWGGLRTGQSSLSSPLFLRRGLSGQVNYG